MTDGLIVRMTPPGDTHFGVGEVIDREPMLSTNLAKTLRAHFDALLDCYHKYSDVHLPGGLHYDFTPFPFRPQTDEGVKQAPAEPLVPRELRNSDLHRLSENSWLQFCRDARLIGEKDGQLMPTEVCHRSPPPLTHLHCTPHTTLTPRPI